MTDKPIESVNLASERLGAAVLAANDEFFARKENLIRDSAPIFVPDKYVSTGKWMDGWETRRRREPGDDWCLVRLGLRGVIENVIVDTSHFTGNYPEECLIEVCDEPAERTPDELMSAATQWTSLVARSRLSGDSQNQFACSSNGAWSHVRLRIFPDGGVARLRVHGRPVPDWNTLDYAGGLADLAAIRNGGCVIDVSDRFYGSPQNMLRPGPAKDMGDGWETKRRRGPGNDWVIVRLGAPGTLSRVVVDTRHFKGNAPGSCSLESASVPSASADAFAWQALLPRVKLQPHTRHEFQNELLTHPAITHVRLNIYPDGGVARLRLLGRTERAATLQVGLGAKNTLATGDLAAQLLACCGSTAWSQRVAQAAPFPDVMSLMHVARQTWRALERSDWLEAFSAHPKIGTHASDGWSAQEQSGVREAEAEVRARLAAGNRAYEEKFGYIFIVCATGKTAGEMLTLLEQRMSNAADLELEIACAEQSAITCLRLEKWLLQ